MHACVNLRTVVGSGEPPLPSGRIRSSLLHLVDIKRRAGAVPPSRPDVRPLAAGVLLIEALAAEQFAVRGRQDIADYLGVKTIAYAMQSIDPLIEQGLVVRTLPDVPRSKRQMFLRSDPVN